MPYTDIGCCWDLRVDMTSIAFYCQDDFPVLLTADH